MGCCGSKSDSVPDVPLVVTLPSSPTPPPASSIPPLAAPSVSLKPSVHRTQSQDLQSTNQPSAVPSIAPLVTALTAGESKSQESKPAGSPVSPIRVQFATPATTSRPVKNEEPLESAEVVPDNVKDLGTRLTRTGTKPAKHGGFSEIWEGELAPNNQKVAIKSLRMVDMGHVSHDSTPAKERLDKRMKREMNVWMPLEHPRILKCLGFAMIDERPSLVSPWCKNGNAREYLDTHPNCNRKAMVVQVAEGLVYLHDREHPIVHFDVKLSNIMISDDEKAMLTDFGVAKVVDEYKTGLTTTNPAAITLKYSSPEAVAGSPRNVKSDVYSFGCVALEIMSDKSPFHQLKSTPSILMAKSSGMLPEPKDHSGIGAEDPLWNLLRKCWRMDSKKRPTMEEVLWELRTLGYDA